MLTIEQINKLEQENAELKAENDKLKSEVGKLTETSERFLNIQYVLADSCRKYEQTLQEIKDRIPKDYEIEQWYEDVMQLITKAEEE